MNHAVAAHPRSHSNPQDDPTARRRTAHLTPRQLDALTLAAEGLTPAQISERLGWKRKHMQALLHDARHEMQARTITHAVVIAVREGLIEPADGRDL